jgi:hypothetical protein
MKALVLALLVSACAPTTNNTTPVYGGGAAPQKSSTKGRGVAMRGKVPRGKRVEYVVAVQIDRQGRRKRIRVRPAADGSYAMQLPPGHRYAMAYEDRGRVVGNVRFPGAQGKTNLSINVSQNVVVNQQFIDLGEPTYVGGVYVAAADPEQYLDNDGDGILDYQDGDDDGDGIDDAGDPDEDFEEVADASMFECDFDEVDDADMDDHDDGDDGHDDE